LDAGTKHICHFDRHGHFTLKQSILPVLNEMHTNIYTGPRLLTEYTQTLGDTLVTDHARGARGVFCHVLDLLKKYLKMSKETMSKSMMS
jgi:hypothetical protein